MTTLNQSIAWSQSMLTSYIPLTAQTGSEPAITIANMVVAFMNAPPFTWATNRAEDSSLSATVVGTSDYTVTIANFGFLEKLSLKDSGGKYWDVKRIYNSGALDKNTDQTKRPDAVSVNVITPGTSIGLRFVSMDDVYQAFVTYQKAPVLFTATTQDWFTQCNIPQNQVHIYNNLFLGECFQVNGDLQDAAVYRRRGMAALLATSDGLTEMQKSMIFAQAMFSDLQTIAAQLRTQAAQQARTV